MQLYIATVNKIQHILNEVVQRKLKNSPCNTVQIYLHFLAKAILMVSLLEIDVASRKIGLLVSMN